MKHKKIIAITGCSGSGKSTALSFIRNNGFMTFDSDQYVHELINNYEVINKLEEITKMKVSNNGRLNYNVVSDFFDRYFDKEIEFDRWFQPYVGEKMYELLKSYNFDEPLFVDAPFIEKRNITNIFNEIWVINSDYLSCFNRIKKRNPNYSDQKIFYNLNRTIIITNFYHNSLIFIDNNSSIYDFLKNINFNIKRILL